MIRFIVEQQPGLKWRVLVESRAGRSVVGSRLIKGGAEDLSYPELDYDFETQEEAERRAAEWSAYVIRSWPRRK